MERVYMASLLICTGRKKVVGDVIAHLKQLARRKQITIITIQKKAKKAWLFNYDELKVLFLSKDGANLPFPSPIIKGLDFISLKPGDRVMIKLSTYTKECDNLKWEILTRSTPFKLKGGHLKIEEIDQGRGHRSCNLSIAGHPRLAIILRDLLIKDEIADPGTVQYII